jgi:hypothetical protein
MSPSAERLGRPGPEMYGGLARRRPRDGIQAHSTVAEHRWRSVNATSRGAREPDARFDASVISSDPPSSISQPPPKNGTLADPEVLIITSQQPVNLNHWNRMRVRRSSWTVATRTSRVGSAGRVVVTQTAPRPMPVHRVGNKIGAPSGVLQPRMWGIGPIPVVWAGRNDSGMHRSRRPFVSTIFRASSESTS